MAVATPGGGQTVSATAQLSSSRGRRASWAVFVLVLIVATALRWFDFPARYEIRDVDETGYLGGGLQLIEGLTPGYKAAPAGPQFWIEWAYVATDALHHLISPTPRVRSLPLAVRPFTALDDALFDAYHDLSRMHRFVVGVNVVISLLGCAAAVSLGTLYADCIGGLLIGGLFATWPLLVSYSEQSRPYAAGWAFAMIGLQFAAGGVFKSRRARLWGMAIFLGLAIGSRIDMLAILPVAWWIYLDRNSRGGRIIRLAAVSFLAGAVACFVAPWLMTSLAGNLRTIATVRFAATPAGRVPWSITLLDYLGPQGAATATLIAVIAVCIQPGRRWIWTALLALCWAAVFASLLKDRGFGVHQHAEVFLTLLVLLAATLPAFLLRWPRFGLLSVLLATLVPMGASVFSIWRGRLAYAQDDSVHWIEQHVPAETVVYVNNWMMPSLLPTPQSSRLLWTEVTDDDAWRKKFQSGLERFGLKDSELPRALSEENLAQERGNRRSWFILGGHTNLPNPRYDVRLVNASPIFGVRDLSAALREKGGVVIWRTCDVAPPPELGAPLAQWLNRAGVGVSIFCTPEVRTRLLDWK